MKAADLFAKGKGASEVARLLGVRRQSAHDWLQSWREGGKKSLQSGGQAGPKSRLNQLQRKELIAALVEGPQSHGYVTALWTLPRVARLIKQRFGIVYHPGHVWRLLRDLGFSCQLPTRRAIERDEAEIKRWKRVEWPRIKKKLVEKTARSSSSTKVG